MGGADVRFTFVPNGDGRNTAVPENADPGNAKENEVKFSKRDVITANTNLSGR